MLKSPTLLIGILGLLVAVAWFAFGGWLSGVKPVTSGSRLDAPGSSSAACGSTSLSRWRLCPVVGAVAVQPVRIQGGMTTMTEVQGRQWL